MLSSVVVKHNNCSPGCHVNGISQILDELIFCWLLKIKVSGEACRKLQVPGQQADKWLGGGARERVGEGVCEKGGEGRVSKR